MHRQLAMTVVLCMATAAVTAKEASKPDALIRLHWLQGDWMGTGTGEPGTSATERHIQCVLDCKYLRVDGRSVYPRQEKNPKGEVHASIDMWSHDRARDRLILRTFDTLGFVTTYVEDPAAAKENTLVLVSEHLENVPAGWKARYTYTFVAPDEYRELFELDPGDKGFETYVDNRFLRIKAAD